MDEDGLEANPDTNNSPQQSGGGGGQQASDGTGASDRKGVDIVHGVETKQDKYGRTMVKREADKNFQPLDDVFNQIDSQTRTALKDYWNPNPKEKNNTTTTEHSAADVVKDVATGTGSNAVVAAKVREGYTEKTGELIKHKGGTLEERTAASKKRIDNLQEARKITPEPYRSMTEKIKPGSSLEVKPDGRFWVTNEKVNNTMKKVGKAGTVGVVIGLGVAAYNINDAYQKGGTEAAVKQTVQEGFSWGGAAVGAATLGWAGARAGAVLGPKGAIAVGAAGAIVGGALGGYLGEKGFKAMFSGW